MGMDIRLQIWKKLTFDLENFLSYIWVWEVQSKLIYRMPFFYNDKFEIAKDIHVKFFNIWCEKRFAMQQSIQ